ncbi:MAG: hypothetical protein Q7T07_04980 [Burkholderiaceae bacterium]|nr:hypothetical protein [Burkholderiaceae bacterium]
MAWLNHSSGSFLGKLPLLLTVAVAALVSGCNVGKTDTVAGAATTTTSGSTTTTTTASGKGCTGSYVGGASPPPHEVRIATRNRALAAKGVAVTGNDAVDNAATGGGGVDGGMYLEGNFAFETDANCNVIKGEFVIFGYPFPISGTVNQDRTFTLSYLGPIVGRVNADNSITGELQHGGGEEYIHGDLWGTFTPNGHI